MKHGSQTRGEKVSWPNPVSGLGVENGPGNKQVTPVDLRFGKGGACVPDFAHHRPVWQTLSA